MSDSEKEVVVEKKGRGRPGAEKSDDKVSKLTVE